MERWSNGIEKKSNTPLLQNSITPVRKKWYVLEINNVRFRIALTPVLCLLLLGLIPTMQSSVAQGARIAGEEGTTSVAPEPQEPAKKASTSSKRSAGEEDRSCRAYRRKERTSGPENDGP
jgi:hypothetical protein